MGLLPLLVILVIQNWFVLKRLGFLHVQAQQLLLVVDPREQLLVSSVALRAWRSQLPVGCWMTADLRLTRFQRLELLVDAGPLVPLRAPLFLPALTACAPGFRLVANLVRPEALLQRLPRQRWKVVQHLALKPECLLCLVHAAISSSVGRDQPGCLRLYMHLGVALQVDDAGEVSVAAVADMVAVWVGGFNSSVPEARQRVA